MRCRLRARCSSRRSNQESRSPNPSSTPAIETTADLVRSLHANGVPDTSYPPPAHHVAYLLDSGTKPYERHPELIELVPLEPYERGRDLASRLAALVRFVSPLRPRS